MSWTEWQLLRLWSPQLPKAKVAGAKSYKMAATNLHGARNMENHLSWINDDESGIYAAKSGYWSDTKCSLAAAYDKNGMQMFLVLLGDTSEGRGDDVTRMITYAENTIKGVRVIKKGKEVGKVRIRQGAVTSLSAYTSEDGYAYLPEEGAKSLISTETEMKKDVTAPVKAGTVVGSFKILVGDDVAKASFLSNHSGGIQGGISNGQPIPFRVAFKPVATLLMPQQTFDIHGNPVTINPRGRHDPCVLPRAVPIVEAMGAMVVLDAHLQHLACRA